MFNNLANTQLADANNEELALAMGAAAKSEGDKGKGSDASGTEEGASPKVINDKTKPAKQPKTSSTKSPISPGFGIINDMVDDDLAIAMSGQTGDQNDDENQDDDDQDDEGATGNENQDDENQNDDEGSDDNDDKDDEGAGDAGNIEVKDFLKARVNLLIEKGEWIDFEDRENIEWDEETFEEMELKQREYQKEVIREELLESFGPYGKQIADYAANGGDPDKLIDLFKEEQRIDNLSIDTEEGQINLVRKYYAQVLGWSEGKVSKSIQTHIADKDLESTAVEFKKFLQVDIDKQIAKATSDQEKAVAAEKARQAAVLNEFSDKVSAYGDTNNDLSPEEKQNIIKVLQFNKTLKNGAPVNEFYFKFADLKKNLPDYIQLVRFVMDPKKFTQNLVTKGNNQAVEKAFKLTRTNNANKKAKTLSAPGGNRTEKPKTAFKLM